MERLRARKGSLLCYEMGLGKTLIGVSVAKEFTCVYVFLPAYLEAAWRDAFAFAEVPLPTFVSYDARTFPRVPAHALVILDESQYVKNRESQRWKRLVPSVRATRNRLLLTGTPMLNRHCELWTQLHLLGYGASWMAFAERYCGARMRSIRRRGRFVRVLDTSASTRGKELRALTEEHGFQYCDKSVLETKLPPKQVRVLRVKEP